jgi:uncharacterized protein
MRKMTLRLCAAFLIGGLAAADLPAAASPQSLAGFRDSGVFKFYFNETPIGTVQFDLSADGTYTRTCAVSLAGRSLHWNLTIHADKDGLWDLLDLRREGESLSVRRRGNQAVFPGPKGETAVALADRHLIWDQCGPALETFLLKRYDLGKKGKQTFSRLLIPLGFERLEPPAPADLELEFIGREKASIEGRESDFNVFEARSGGQILRMWADLDLKIDMIKNSSQGSALVRQGFEALATNGGDPLLSKPIYQVSRTTVMIPMRDGVKLATDLYMPQSKDARWPVILRRTPYDKKGEELSAQSFARRGYIVAVQDCRGLFGSEGVFEPFVVEPEDGYDTVEWLGTREWSTGKVGMMGLSYQGWVQLWAASRKPPHLTTIIPSCSPADPFMDNPYLNGVFMPTTIDLVQIFQASAAKSLNDQAMIAILYKRHDLVLKSLPVIELDRMVLGREVPYWRRWIEHDRQDAYWERASFVGALPGFDIPVFLQTGWFDLGANGTRLIYEGLKKSRNPHIKLVIGPWGHTDQSSSRYEDYDFGAAAAADLQTAFLRWFDYWLKGVPNKILDEPLVQVFSMVTNKWLTGPAYPLPGTQTKSVFLSSARGANTSRGDGLLTDAIAGAGRDFDQYVYDPGDPTPYPDYFVPDPPSPDGSDAGPAKAKAQADKKQAGHRAVTEKRSDILVFRTEPLKTAVQAVGPVSLDLYASTSAVDTDWLVSLMDESGDGRILHLGLGGIRARFRDSLMTPKPLKPGDITRYTIDLGHTGMTFAPGHRIRIEIASTFFPLFSRNLNTGGSNETSKVFIKATQRIYHSKAYPSRLLLSVFPSE